MTDILCESGTSKGGFYNHFKSKEDLFFQVLEVAKQIWRQKNMDGLNQIKAPIEKIIRFLENFKDKYLKDAENFPGGCVFITLSVDLKNQNPHLSKTINTGFKGFKAMLKRLFKQAQENGELKKQTDIDAVSEIIFSAILGISVTYSLDNSDENLDYSIDSLINYVNSNRN